MSENFAEKEPRPSSFVGRMKEALARYRAGKLLQTADWLPPRAAAKGPSYSAETNLTEVDGRFVVTLSTERSTPHATKYTTITVEHAGAEDTYRAARVIAERKVVWECDLLSRTCTFDTDNPYQWDEGFDARYVRDEINEAISLLVIPDASALMPQFPEL